MEPEMQEFLDTAEQFEQRMRDGEKSLREAVVTGWSADRTVSVVASGLGQVKSVRVDPRVFDRPDADRLAAAITEAIRDAAAIARKLAEERMGPVEINLH